MKVKTCLVWYAVICFSVWMGSARADTVYLQDLLVEADSSNPSIIAARHRYEAAEARVSGLRYLPDPLVGVEFAPGMRMYSITQAIPFPTKLSTRSSVARTEVDEYQRLYEGEVLDVAKRIKQTYAELFFVHRKIQTIKESIGFLEQFFAIASQHYALGHAPQTDVLRAQIELAKTENELRTAQDMKEVTEARLNTLLNRETDADIGTPQPINTTLTTLEIDELYEMARTNHPELAAVQHMVERAELMKSFAYQQYLPDFMFKFTQVEMEGEFTDQKYMFGFTVPLWFLGKQSKMVTEASAQIEMLQAYHEKVENSLLLDVKAAKVETDKNKRTLTLYEQSIIPQAHANVKSALVAYEANQVDFMTLLESERIHLQFQLEHYRAQADFFKSIAELEEAVGTNIFSD